jgi:adenylate cyclase
MGGPIFVGDSGLGSAGEFHMATLDKAVARPGAIRMSIGSALLLLFALFAVAPLFGILAYSYQRNESAALSSLERQLGRNMDETVRAAAQMIDTVGRTMAVVAAAAGRQPEQFRDAGGNEILWRALTAADQIDAIYTSFEDGYHRVVSRIDDDRRRFEPIIPKDANWHASYIDDFSAGAARSRHRSFFSQWGTPSGTGYSFATDLDVRGQPHYVHAKAKRSLALGEPSINPDTGSPVMALGFPVLAGERFIGFVGANMTLGTISAYLADNRLSANSVTLIYDRAGRLIAASDAGLLAATAKGEIPRLDRIADPTIAEAVAMRDRAGAAPYVFTAKAGQELSLASRPFPAEFGMDWNILAISPTDDFVGDLRATNRQVAGMIIVIILAELTLILLISRRISRSVAGVVGEFAEIGRFNLLSHDPIQSIVKEIVHLSASTERMKSSLRSFGRYVPTDLVRELLASGREAVLGGERRSMTIQFSDIAGFTSISEKLTPERLVDELGDYFALMREALRKHHGTLDKYMGDGILAFFNAPQLIPNHETEACHAALESQRRLAVDRERRTAEGRPPFSARIGLAVGEVIVGNIGTADRFAYTVIGDSVNLASRLEGVCKFYGVAITASGEVRAATGDAFEWRQLDRVAVVGRAGGTDIHELLGRKGELPPAVAAARDAYETALADYFVGNFGRAAARFRDLANADPSNLAADMMARRARKLNRTPPDGEWTGVYVHTKK